MYVVVTDYVKPNTGEDLSDALQELILANPQRTIFFPDGEYLLSKPICTPANPAHAVSLKLATFAKLKAMDSWTENEAVVRMGAAEPFNTEATTVLRAVSSTVTARQTVFLSTRDARHRSITFRSRILRSAYISNGAQITAHQTLIFST